MGSSAYTNYMLGGSTPYVQPGENKLKYYAQPNVGGYYYYGGGGGGGGSAAPTAPPAAAPAPAGPASPTASASDLQVMIASIPIAQDGQVISAEYHNGLRAALIAMANRLGLGTISEEITVTNAPRFFKVDGQGEWKADVGQVKKASADTGALRGWMELDLPDGARIKKMVVYAANDSAGTMRVELRRQKMTDPASIADLISIDVANNDATTGKEGDVTLPGSGMGAAAIEETRAVNNREYKYLLVAELDAGVSGKEARLTGVQVLLGK